MAMTLARVLPGWSWKRERRVDAMECFRVPAPQLIFGSGYCATCIGELYPPWGRGMVFIDADTMGGLPSGGTAVKSSHGAPIRRPKGRSWTGAFCRAQC